MTDNRLTAARRDTARALRELGTVLAVLGLQVIRVLALLLVPALRLACASIAGIGAVLLFGSVTRQYGSDGASVILALAVTLAVPAFLLSRAGVWASSAVAGVLFLLLHYVIERAPPIAIALIPPVILSACILSLTMEGIHERQRRQSSPVDSDNSPDHFHGEPERAPGPVNAPGG